jgi:hypothetical protein
MFDRHPVTDEIAPDRQQTDMGSHMWGKPRPWADGKTDYPDPGEARRSELAALIEQREAEREAYEKQRREEREAARQARLSQPPLRRPLPAPTPLTLKLEILYDKVQDPESGEYIQGDPQRAEVSVTGSIPLDVELLERVSAQKQAIRDRLKSEYQAIQVPEAQAVRKIQTRLQQDQKSLADTETKLKEMEEESQELDLAPAELTRLIKGMVDARTRIEILTGHVEARTQLLEQTLRKYQAAYRQAAQDIKDKVLAEVEEAKVQTQRLIEGRAYQLVSEVGAALMVGDWADYQPRSRYEQSGAINEFDPVSCPDPT